jgi:hypothetical protein
MNKTPAVKKDFTSGLNASQKKAVLHNEGPILVLAGAGSGKTRVLTMRIARLVHEKQCRPEEILAVTFTNKAAREMRERVAALTSPKAAEAMTLCTFHSLGAKILREDGASVGIKPSFSIIDDHERTATLRTVMRSSGIRGLKDDENDKLANQISLAKNGALEPDAFKARKIPRSARRTACTTPTARSFSIVNRRLRRPAAFAAPCFPEKSPKCSKNTGNGLRFSLWTSFRTRTAPRWNWCRSLPRRATTCSPWATTTRRSTPGGGPTSPTFFRFRSDLTGA